MRGPVTWPAALGLAVVAAVLAGCGPSLAQRQALRATRYATTDTTIVVAMTKALADARYRLGALRDTEVVAQIVYYRDNGTALRRETGDLSPNLPFGQGLDRVYGVVMVGRLAGISDARRVEFVPRVWLYRPGTVPMPPRPRRPAAPDLARRSRRSAPPQPARAPAAVRDRRAAGRRASGRARELTSTGGRHPTAIARSSPASVTRTATEVPTSAPKASKATSSRRRVKAAARPRAPVSWRRASATM
jgi:hypothetical protein